MHAFLLEIRRQISKITSGLTGSRKKTASQEIIKRVSRPDAGWRIPPDMLRSHLNSVYFSDIIFGDKKKRAWYKLFCRCPECSSSIFQAIYYTSHKLGAINYEDSNHLVIIAPKHYFTPPFNCPYPEEHRFVITVAEKRSQYVDVFEIHFVSQELYVEESRGRFGRMPRRNPSAARLFFTYGRWDGEFLNYLMTAVEATTVMHHT